MCSLVEALARSNDVRNCRLVVGPYLQLFGGLDWFNSENFASLICQNSEGGPVLRRGPEEMFWDDARGVS